MKVTRRAAWELLTLAAVVALNGAGRSTSGQELRRLPPTTQPLVAVAPKVEAEAHEDRSGLARIGSWSKAVRRAVGASTERIRGASPLEFVRNRIARRPAETPVDPFVAAETLASEAVVDASFPQAKTHWSVFPTRVAANGAPPGSQIAPIATTMSLSDEAPVQRTSAAMHAATDEGISQVTAPAEATESKPGRLAGALAYTRNQAKNLFGFLDAQDDHEAPGGVDTAMTPAAVEPTPAAGAKAPSFGRSKRFGRRLRASRLREQTAPTTVDPAFDE